MWYGAHSPYWRLIRADGSAIDYPRDFTLGVSFALSPCAKQANEALIRNGWRWRGANAHICIICIMYYIYG